MSEINGNLLKKQSGKYSYNKELYSIDKVADLNDKLNDKYKTNKDLDDSIINMVNAKNLENEILNFDECDHKVIPFRSMSKLKIINFHS